MAQTTFTFRHSRAADYSGTSTMSARDALLRATTFMRGILGGVYSATEMQVSSGSQNASGTVTLSGVGDTAASQTVTLSGGADDVEVTLGAQTLDGPVPAEATDALTAAALATAINADVNLSLNYHAVAVGAVVTITYLTKGTTGNAITISTAVTAGTAARGAATLAGGANGLVTVTVQGTAVPVATTNMTDAAAATAVAAAITSAATVKDLVGASASGAVVTLTAEGPGPLGNLVTLASTSAVGTATRSAATLTGGTVTTYTF